MDWADGADGADEADEADGADGADGADVDVDVRQRRVPVGSLFMLGLNFLASMEV